METRRQRASICRCDHRAPPKWVLRSVKFNRKLAQYYCDQPKSGDVIVNDVLNEIYYCRTGRLIGPDGKEICVDTEVAAFDDAFGEDPRRWINRYRERVAHPRTNRLDGGCAFEVTILHFAKQVYLCRTQGSCNR